MNEELGIGWGLASSGIFEDPKRVMNVECSILDSLLRSLWLYILQGEIFVPLLGSFARKSTNGLSRRSVPGYVIGAKLSWFEVKYMYPSVATDTVEHLVSFSVPP